MRFDNTFAVPASPDAVYEAMLDIPRVAGCLPGATIGEETADGHQATIAVKVGPIRLTYGGTVKVSDSDRAARTASMTAKAREQRGQGTAQATIAMAVHGEPAGSRVEMTTDMMVTGRVAQMGQGIMQEVANSMVGQFAECLQARLAATPGPADGAAPMAPASEVSALPLLLRAIAARIRALFRRH